MQNQNQQLSFNLSMHYIVITFPSVLYHKKQISMTATYMASTQKRIPAAFSWQQESSFHLFDKQAFVEKFSTSTYCSFFIEFSSKTTSAPQSSTHSLPVHSYYLQSYCHSDEGLSPAHL